MKNAVIIYYCVAFCHSCKDNWMISVPQTTTNNKTGVYSFTKSVMKMSKELWRMVPGWLDWVILHLHLRFHVRWQTKLQSESEVYWDQSKHQLGHCSIAITLSILNFTEDLDYTVSHVTPIESLDREIELLWKCMRDNGRRKRWNMGNMGEIWQIILKIWPLSDEMSDENFSYFLIFW